MFNRRKLALSAYNHYSKSADWTEALLSDGFILSQDDEESADCSVGRRSDEEGQSRSGGVEGQTGRTD